MSDLSSDSVDLTLDDSSFNDSDSLISLVAGPGDSLVLGKSLDDLDSLSTVSVVSSVSERSNLVSDKLAGLSVLLSFKSDVSESLCLKILNFFSSFLHDFFWSFLFAHLLLMIWIL